MKETRNKNVKITIDQYYGITETKKKNGAIYLYLRYRFGSRKESVVLPENFYDMSKVAQQKAYKEAKEKLDIKLNLSRNENKDMRKVPIIALIDEYLKDKYDTAIKTNINRRRSFDDKQYTTRPQIERHSFADCTVAELVEDDYYIKEFFRESREGFFSEKAGKYIKPCAKSTIEKQVFLLKETLRFARLDKKWISRDDFEIIEYQIQKYKEVGNFSKKNRDTILSKHEFALFHKEIFTRLDTQENFKDMFKEELELQCKNEDVKRYILYLFKMERKQIMPATEEIEVPSIEGVDYEEMYQLYKKVENTVKEKVENGFMTNQPELHYPIVRYYRNEEGHFTTEIPNIKPEYADLYKIERKTKSSKGVHYYTHEGSLAALFLLFNVNTGLRFNENRSLKVKNIKRIKVDVSEDETVYAYYIKLESQVYNIYERDENGEVVYDELGKKKRRQITANLKTKESERKIPLNENSIHVLKIVQEMTGTKIFDEDGSISEVHAERFIFINYDKLNYESKRFLGRKPVYYNDLRCKLTYGTLKEITSIEEEKIMLKDSGEEEEGLSKSFYYEQIKELKERIENGEEFDWDKQVYVVKLPSLLSDSNTNKVLKRIAANMRVQNPKDFTIHSLRKTASSIMAEQGHSKIDIKHIIGHTEDSEVTEQAYIYTNFLPALRAVQSLDEATETWNPPD